MKVLFFVHTLSRTRHFRGVVRGLVERGHTVVLATAGRTEPQTEGRGEYSHPRVQVVACPRRRSDSWRDSAEWLRKGRDRLRYCDPRYANASALTARAVAHTPKDWARALDRHPWIARRWQIVQRALAAAEALVPCDPEFLAFLDAHAPDVVLVTPLVEFGSYQTDYIKCAHRRGTPVAYLPFSWDNLTNRGLIRVIPDRVLVWNAHQRREAIQLHGVPASRLVVTGAPRFDEFFQMRPSTSRDVFCRGLGFDPAAPLLLYLCSSGFVAPREQQFVRRWIEELRRGGRSSWVGTAPVLIRPHPAYQEEWDTADLSDLPGVAVWSRRSKIQDDRHLFDALYHAAAVVGLNTSAMIEAAIVGRPVFTITAPEFTGGQAGTMHFHYLLADNGGVVTVAPDLAVHRAQLEQALEGAAETARRSRQFLAAFVRPHGLDVAASGIMVEAIEQLAAIRKAPAAPPWWHTPLRAALARSLTARSART